MPGAFKFVQKRFESVTTSMWLNVGVSALLAIHTGLLAYGATVHSPTYNEPAHLVAGIYYWQFGRFDVYCVNPPLVRMVATIPVLLTGCETDWEHFRESPGARPEMALGSSFCAANGARTVWLITIARLACIPFSLLGGYICFRWARELYGPVAGLLSLALWCFCPNIIAHGQLITCDAAATAIGVTACYTFWHWLKSPTWWNTITSGLILGVAELTKTTLIIFYPLWPLLWLAYRWKDRRELRSRDWLRELSMLLIRMTIGLYVINLGYGFEGSFTQLGDFKFVSQSLTGIPETAKANRGGNCFTDSWIGNVPVPLPKNYLVGIDLQRADFETYDSEFYLAGVWSKTGWWYYYLYALAIKIPIGTWLLLLVAVGIRIAIGGPASRRDEFYLLAPAAIILTFVSSQLGMNEHMRYVLPIFPFAYIWLGSVTRLIIQREHQPRASIQYRATVCIVVMAVVWSIGSGLASFPHSLSYFNELIGGPRNGWKHLANSNIDWGQDLLYLKHWAENHPQSKPLKTAIILTLLSPELTGIDEGESSIFDDASDLPPGFYAVGMTTLSGFGQTDHGARLRAELDRAVYRENIGGSIIVFKKE